MFATIHWLAHPGIRATTPLVSSRFVWHWCASDVAGWCRDCQTCQRGGDAAAGGGDTEHPCAREAVHALPCGFGGAAPHFGGGVQVPLHLFTIIDRSTRWVEAIPATAAAERADWLRRRRRLPHSALWTPETAVTGRRWLRRRRRLPHRALWTPETAVTGRRLPRLSQKTAATPSLPGGRRQGRLTACGCAKNQPQ